jgi:diguanylate cyclase (GGDEF)-like protein
VDFLAALATIAASVAALRVFLLRRRVRALEALALTDPLTGAFNRRHLERCLAAAVDRRSRAGEPAVLLAIDIDRFKDINDSLGHAAGDRALAGVVEAIADRMRKVDVLCRTGGDEFALLLEGCPSATAMRIADEVRLAIVAIALPWEGRVLRVGASLGVSMLTPETPGVDAWLKEADAACYEVKRTGRGAVRANGASRLALVP